MVGQYRWHSTGPGPDMNLEITQVVTLRQGKMVMVEYFRHHSEALEAVGLSEQDAHATPEPAYCAGDVENVALCRSMRIGSAETTHWMDPDIEAQFIGDTPSSGTSKGLDGMAVAWREWLGAWREFQVEADEYRKLDKDRVLVLCRFAGRGKASGLEIGQVWTKGRAPSKSRRQGDKASSLHRLPAGARRSQPFGVGDVAGERGGGPLDLRGLGRGDFRSAGGRTPRSSS